MSLGALPSERAAAIGRQFGSGLAALLVSPITCLAAERSRWPLWIPVFIGAGIGIYFALAAEPPGSAGAIAMATAALTAAIVRHRPPLLAAGVAALAMAAGFAAAQWSAWLSAAPTLEQRLGPVTVEGRVVDVDLLSEGRRIVFEPQRIGKRTAGLPAKLRVRLRRSGDALAPGDRILVQAILLPPPGPAMPGAYDFQRQAFFERLGGVGFAVGPAHRLAPLPDEGRSRWSVAVARLRQAMTERILAVLPGGTGGVAAALIAGEMGPIPPEVNAAFRDSGLAHLLSISGIHMSFVAGISFVALRALLALVPFVALRWPIKKWAAGLALVLVVAYTVLAGASVPAQRSCLMLVLALLAVIVDRLHISMRVVAWAAVAVMFYTPVGILGPSFQMSFAAVVALVSFYETFRSRLAALKAGRGVTGGALLYFAGVLLTSVVATLATTPFAIYHFNRFAVYGLFSNMLAVPVAGFWVMPWAMASCLLMPFGLESWGLVPMGWGVDAIIGIARRFADWPQAVVNVPAMPVAALVAISLGGLWLCLWRGKWRRLGVVPILAGIVTIPFQTPPDILIADDARTIAVRTADGGYIFSRARPSHFIADTWTRRAGPASDAVWPKGRSTADGVLSCDTLGCLYRGHGRIVALDRKPQALAEDCRTADLVVSEVPVRWFCRARTKVIGRFDVWRNGGYAVWLEPVIQIESVNGERGDRPWVPHRRSRRDQERKAGEGSPDQ